MILVDPRAGSGELAPLITELGPTTKLEQLAFGDFAFPGNGPGEGAERHVMVGVERKAVADLVQSMRSGRLSGHQLPGLLDTYDYNYIVVEGMWRPRPDTTGVLQVRRCKSGENPKLDASWFWVDYRLGGRDTRPVLYAELDNYLTTLEAFHPGRLWVRRTASQYETARVVVDLSVWWMKKWSDHSGHKAFNTAGDDKGRRRVLMTRRARTVERGLNAIVNGIGWERAQAIGKEFKTIRKVIEAGDAGRLTEIDGVGEVMARRVMEAVDSDK